MMKMLPTLVYPHSALRMTDLENQGVLCFDFHIV